MHAYEHAQLKIKLMGALLGFACAMAPLRHCAMLNMVEVGMLRAETD